MSAPLIGITTYRQYHTQGFPLISMVEAYTQAVSQAGGLPVAIPLGLMGEQLQDLLPRLDGLLLSGGGDIDPNLFGAHTHPAITSIDPDRDRVEVQLIRDAIQKGIPFLGICRGIQTLNVALGGSLYTHIPDQHPNALHHAYLEGSPRSYLAHQVHLLPKTHLLEILGESDLFVNSMHHQGIERLAPSLAATAHAPDGLIEAVELPGYHFGIGVQWHPEWLTAHASMRTLFRAFIQAANT